MKRLASLTSRLVVTAVALVLVVSVLIGTATALAMDSYLTSRLDDQISSSLERATRGGPAPPEGPRDGGINPSNQAPGTLIAILGERPSGLVLTQTIGGDRELSTAALDALADVPVDGTVHEVDLPAFGSYRVAATTDASGTTFATGLPTASVDEAMGSLVRWEALLTVLGVGAATGAGLFVVRRQLRPLREVAETAHAVSELPPRRGRDRPGRAGARPPHRRAHRGRSGGGRAEHPPRARRVVPVGAAPQRAAGPPVRRRRLPRASHAAVHDQGLRRAGAGAGRTTPTGCGPPWTRWSPSRSG